MKNTIDTITSKDTTEFLKLVAKERKPRITNLPPREDGKSVPAPSFLYLGDDGNGGVTNIPEPDNYDEGSGTLAEKL